MTGSEFNTKVPDPLLTHHIPAFTGFLHHVNGEGRKKAKAQMKHNNNYRNNKLGLRKDTKLKEAKPNVHAVHGSRLQFDVLLNWKTSNASSLGSSPRHTSNNLAHAVLSHIEIARSLFLGKA